MLKKMYKKAQGATEYLIILAIVIIIALIVVGVMGGIPGIGGGASTRASSSYWDNLDLALTDWAISAGSADTVIVKNNLRNQITLEHLFVNSVDIASNNVVGVGASKTLTGAIAACTAGETFSYNVSITYIDGITNGNFTVTGDGNRLEGTCAS